MRPYQLPRSLAPALFALLQLCYEASAGDDCKPHTWDNGDLEDIELPIMAPAFPQFASAVVGRQDIQPGEVNCRARCTSGDTINYYSCMDMASVNGLSIEEWFFLNPEVYRDCSNIKPHSMYCIRGFIEPVRAYDGFCGPKYSNATCVGMSKQCCNSETWTCGDTTEDCAPGVCYEGICLGHKVYTTDGSCGVHHEGRLCAGKWGDCCDMNGQCGTGEDYCGPGACQSGNCNTHVGPLDGDRNDVPWLDGNTPDGSCGGINEYSCHVAFGNCCNKNGKCSSLPEDCEQGCQPKFGMCGTSK